jgi:hypothetical protein
MRPGSHSITRRQFMALQRGDVVRWGRSGWRIVLEGPADRAVNVRLGWVVFAKRAVGGFRGQRYGGFTCYGWSEVSRKVALPAEPVPPGMRRALADLEAGRLFDLGFNAQQESRAIIASRKRSDGLGLCRLRCHRWPAEDDAWSRLPPAPSVERR